MIPKFRAWHKELKEMFMVEHMQWEDGKITHVTRWRIIPGYKVQVKLPVNETKNIELMQWTGLQDVKGIDIYEGDIIVEDFLGRKGRITFGEHETSADYYASTAYGFYIEFADKEPYSLSLNQKLMVLGNIYTNPELLEPA